MNTEIKEFINSKSHNSPITIKNYREQYKRFYNKTNKNITEMSEKDILKTIEEMSNCNVSSFWTLLQLPYMIRVLNNKPVDLIQDKRTILKELVKQHTKQKLIEKRDTLPDISIIKKYYKKALDDGEIKKYVVNYLLINYALRNEDVNLFITDTKTKARDTSNNYLIINKTACVLVINNYKTVKNYGTKTIVIKSKEFLEAVRKLKMNTYLLTGTSEPLPIQNLCMTVIRLTYNLLGEGSYFKILMNWINTRPNSSKLMEYYSRTRGTAVQTMIENYDTGSLKEGDVEI